MAVPAELKAVFEADTADDAKMGDLMKVLCDVLDCDRCLLFLRDPDSRKSRCTHGYETDPSYALDRPDDGWATEPENLVSDDPMFAEAMHNPEALYIDNIETASPDLVNAAYEREHFKHQALVHAPLQQDGKLYGILEPCTIAAPRQWTDADRETIAWTMEQLTPIAVAYVAANCH